MKIFYFLTIIISISLSFSQSNRDIKYYDAVASEALDHNNYLAALSNYSVIDSIMPNNGDALYKIGYCYNKLGYYEDALASLNKATRAGFDDPVLIKTFGSVFHMNNDFETALEFYQRYEAVLRKDEKNNEVEILEIIYLEQQCENGVLLSVNPMQIKMIHLDKNINSQYQEYAPVVSSNEDVLFFTSRRPNSKGGNQEYFSGKYFEDIYMSYRKDEGSWTKPKNIEILNTDLHDASAGLSSDGKVLIIYRPDRKNMMGGDLYISFLEGTGEGMTWSSPSSLGKNINSSYLESSACISENKKMIYFSSDRPGGFGGIDLYKSQIDEEGNWGKAINLGSNINTQYDEDSPYLNMESNVLYFSSKGHNSIGGYDIFMAYDNDVDGYWSAPENLGMPINSARDDSHFSWNKDQTRGYFSSVKADSFGGNDIYVIERPSGSVSSIYFKGTVSDSVTGGVVPKALVKVVNERNGNIIAIDSTSENGNFRLPIEMGEYYTVYVEANGYTSVRKGVSVPVKSQYFEVSRNLELKPYTEEAIWQSSNRTGKTGHIKKQELKELVCLGKGDHIVVRQIQFEFNKYKLSKSSKKPLNEIVSFMKTNPSVVIEVGGHTDNVGSRLYNAKLSRKRAQTVANYVVEQGIDEEKVIVHGYGETNPLVNNNTRDGRFMNRRVEFTVMKSDKLREVFAMENELKKMQKYLDLAFHFPVNEYKTVSKTNKKEIVKMANYLIKHPNEKIKIHAHGDPTGTEMYNSILAAQRASTVKQSFLKYGVNQAQLEIALTVINGFDVKNRQVQFELVH